MIWRTRPPTSTATVGEVVPAEITTAAPATAAGVVRTGAAWARYTAAREEEATEGLLGGNRAARTRVGGLVPTPRAHPPTLHWGGEVGSPPPDVKVVQPLKRQVPSLVDVVSLTERLAKITISAESAQPLSSALARERQAAVDEAVARQKPNT